MLLDQHIIGIHFSGNSVENIQRTITLLISNEIMQNLGSNSSSESVLSKTFRPHVEIPYRSKVISKPNSRANRWTSIFTPLHRHIIGIHFSGNSVGHIQRTITLLISKEIMQNFCSNSTSECVLSKTLWRHPKIPCLSKVIVETVTEGHISSHFRSDYSS